MEDAPARDDGPAAVAAAMAATLAAAEATSAEIDTRLARLRQKLPKEAEDREKVFKEVIDEVCRLCGTGNAGIPMDVATTVCQ